jgi:hypothetical protein
MRDVSYTYAFTCIQCIHMHHNALQTKDIAFVLRCIQSDLHSSPFDLQPEPLIGRIQYITPLTHSCCIRANQFSCIIAPSVPLHSVGDAFVCIQWVAFGGICIPTQMHFFRTAFTCILDSMHPRPNCIHVHPRLGASKTGLHAHECNTENNASESWMHMNAS